MLSQRKDILKVIKNQLETITYLSFNLTENTNISFDLNISSTDLSNLISQLKDYYDIVKVYENNEYYDYENFITIGDIIDFIIQNIKE